MTPEQIEAAKEYRALLNARLAFSEIYEAVVYASDLIRRRMSIVTNLLGRTDNPGDESCQFAVFCSNAERLLERLQMMGNLCQDDVNEYILSMDTAARHVIGQEVPSKGNKSPE